MKLLPILLCFVAILHSSYAPPVTEKKEQDSEIKDDLDEYMEYHRYLKEVVQALESDPDFRERLEKANDEDVRSGKIAEQLDFVNHNVRTKLDEIKRRELERLRHLATKQYELTNNLDVQDLEHNPRIATNEHLDHVNPHTFEIEDLKKLIKKTTSDLEIADKQRKDQFKEYEMQKEFEKHQKLEELNEDEKKVFQKKIDEEESAKKHHKPIHHPGSKQQLEEVWEKQDHMQDQQFDPKAFFMMHDVDGNGVWDADEVKALFVKELDKMYGPGGPNKDLRERAEEMERMREHVFTEADKNRDGLIDFHEFMQETQKADFNQDQGWQPIDENQIYTHDEYENYEKARRQEIKYLQERGLVDAHGRPIPGAEHHLQGAYPPGQHYPQGQGFDHPAYQGQYPPQHGQYPPQGQVPQGQYPPQGQVPQGVPHGQYPPQGQVPQGQYPPQGQVQQGQYPPQGQVPQGQYPQQGQVPQGQYPPQGQVPQGQYPQQGQVPQGQYPPQGQLSQGQYPPQGQVPQGQYPPQGQVPQGIPPQAQVPQGQVLKPQASPLGQVPAPTQVPVQGQAPVQGQVPQGQSQPQAQGQAPPQAGNEAPKV